MRHKEMEKMRQQFEFRSVVTARERELASEFWQVQFRDTAPHLRERPNEQMWLEYSHIIAGFHDGRVVAACRLSPYHPELGWEASEDLGEGYFAGIDPARCAQLNRVAVRSDVRNLRLHERMFHALSLFVIEYTPFDSFFSIIREPLVRLYKPLAIHPIHDAPMVLPSRGNQKYVIVRGNVSITYQRLSVALGLDRPPYVASQENPHQDIHATRTHISPLPTEQGMIP